MGIIKSINYKFLGVYVSPRLLETLRETAQEKKETVSDLVRRLLREALQCAE